MIIAVLEDNAARRDSMRQCLADKFFTYEAKFFASPQPMVEYLRGHLNEAICISLDHDMELIEALDGGLLDPGTGEEVAEFRATRPPQCPVIIHSTNSNAAERMGASLRDAGWTVHRVVPYGDLEWIREAWLRTIRRTIVDSAREPHVA